MPKSRTIDISIETAEALYLLLSTEQQKIVERIPVVMSNGDYSLTRPLVEGFCNSVRQRNAVPLADVVNGKEEHATRAVLVGLRRSVFDVLAAKILQTEGLGSSALEFVIELFDLVLHEAAMRRFAQATADAADSMMLYDMSCSLVTSSSFDELVEVTMTYLAPFGANSSSVLRFDSAPSEIQVQVVSSLPRDSALTLRLEKATTKNGPLAPILFSSSALVVDDAENDPTLDVEARNVLRECKVGGLLSAPLLIRADLVGRLVVTWPLRRPLHAHVVRMLHALAMQATAVAERLLVMERYQKEIEERTLLESSLVDAQQALVRELGTPIIPLADDIILMPLVGTIDETRAGRITEVMLAGIVASGAATAILDLSGVPVATARVAESLVGVTRAVRLVGAEVVLTGIRPDMAKTLVEGGAMFEGFVIRSTVQSGIAFALAKSSARKRGPPRHRS